MGCAQSASSSDAENGANALSLANPDRRACDGSKPEQDMTDRTREDGPQPNEESFSSTTSTASSLKDALDKEVQCRHAREQCAIDDWVNEFRKVRHNKSAVQPGANRENYFV